MLVTKLKRIFDYKRLVIPLMIICVTAAALILSFGASFLPTAATSTNVSATADLPDCEDVENGGEVTSRGSRVVVPVMIRILVFGLRWW